MIKASLILAAAFCIARLFCGRSAAERHILWARDLAIAQLPLIASAPRGASAG